MSEEKKVEPRPEARLLGELIRGKKEQGEEARE